MTADRESTSETLLRKLVEITPWDGGEDEDWCHFCNARPSYEAKPWTGHEPNCAWLRASTYLTNLVRDRT